MYLWQFTVFGEVRHVIHDLIHLLDLTAPAVAAWEAEQRLGAAAAAVMTPVGKRGDQRIGAAPLINATGVHTW